MRLSEWAIHVVCVAGSKVTVGLTSGARGGRWRRSAEEREQWWIRWRIGDGNSGGLGDGGRGLAVEGSGRFEKVADPHQR